MEILLKIRPARQRDSDRTPRRGPLHMEQAFASLHSLPGRHTVTFAIANFADTISFFARADDTVVSAVESQLYAQYPDCDIERIQPSSLEPHGGEEVQTATLGLVGPTMFPIKRHPQFDDLLNRITIDPLSGITSTLSHFPDPRMRGSIAVTFRPVSKRLRRRVLRFLPLVTRGLPRRWLWYRLLFTTVHLSRGWRRILLFPLDMALGGFRSWFVNIGNLPVPASVDSAPTSAEDIETRRAASRSHDREDAVQGAQDKMHRLLFDASIAVSVIAPRDLRRQSRAKLREIAGSFKQFALPHSNSFRIVKTEIRPSFPRALPRSSFLLSSEELATIWHLPTMLVQTPNIGWVTSRRLESPNELPVEEGTTVLGEAVFRGKRTRFGIRLDDRRRHVYTIGKTGMGKSTLILNMIVSDILAGRGVALIDPHGDLADAVLGTVPKGRTNDVVLFDPTDQEYPISFNMLECRNPAQRPLIASGLMAVFTKIWPDVWSGRMEHILRNTLLALLESNGNSMLGIMRMYADDAFRGKIVSHLSDPLVRSFWEHEYTGWSEKYRTEAVAAIQNKVGQLLSTPVIRNIVGQVTSTVDLRHAMDTGKIVIVNLSKGKLGDDNSNFLGSMLVTKFQIDAMSRADVPESERKDFSLYVDEFQNFATVSFASVLSEARKYRLDLTLANQYIGQLTPERGNTTLHDAVFGNVGTIVSFQIGSEDAEEIAKQFGDEQLGEDLVALPKYHAYMRLMIDGVTSRPFSVVTLPPPSFARDREPCLPAGRRIETIRMLSRERYAEERSAVEEKIRKWAAGASSAREKQKTGAKAKEKEIEEIMRAKRKGMKLTEYRTWRDREMWTNKYNALRKRQSQGEPLSPEERMEMEELNGKLDASGGPTVNPTMRNE